MNATLLISTLLVLALIAAPERTLYELTLASYKIQVWCLNLRMKYAAWRIYRGLARDMKKTFGSDIPPFSWVDLWDRK